MSTGQRCAELLFEEIRNGGCVDTQHQALCCMLMVIGPEDVSKVRFGKLSPYTIAYLRDLRDFMGVTFKVTADEETHTTLYVFRPHYYSSNSSAACQHLVLDFQTLARSYNKHIKTAIR